MADAYPYMAKNPRWVLGVTASGLGHGPLAAGLGLMPWGATTTFVPQLAGRLIGKFGERRFVLGGMSFHAASMIWITGIARPDLPYWQLVVPLVLSGAGVAMSVPAAQSVVLGAVEPQDIGRASGAFSTLRQLGGTFGVAVLVAVFAGAGGYSSPQAFSNGFAPAIAVCGALALLAALAGAAIPARRPAAAARDLSAHVAPATPGGKA